MTILAQKGRITDDAVESTLQLGRKPGRVFEVVVHELFKDAEAFVVFEEVHLGAGGVFP